MTKKIYTLEELIHIIGEVVKDFEVKKAILFGSYAKNVPTPNSDIDLVIDSEGRLLNIKFYGLLQELIDNLEKNVDLIEISEIKKGSAIDEEIRKEGVVVYEK